MCVYVCVYVYIMQVWACRYAPERLIELKIVICVYVFVCGLVFRV